MPRQELPLVPLVRLVLLVLTLVPLVRLLLGSRCFWLLGHRGDQVLVLLAVGVVAVGVVVLSPLRRMPIPEPLPLPPLQAPEPVARTPGNDEDAHAPPVQDAAP